MATIHDVAQGAAQLADTTARVAEASANVAAVAGAADEVVRSSRNLMRWFLISLIVLAVAGAVMTAMKKKQSSNDA